MSRNSRLVWIVCVAAALTGCAHNRSALTKPAKISFDEAGGLVVDGEKVFPINLTVIPRPDGMTPWGKHAYQEFHDSGCMFMRTGPGASGRRRIKATTKTEKAAEEDESPPQWTENGFEEEREYQEAAAAHGMRCCPWLGWTLANFKPEDKASEAKLHRLVNTFKDSPGMGLW